MRLLFPGRFFLAIAEGSSSSASSFSLEEDDEDFFFFFFSVLLVIILLLLCLSFCLRVGITIFSSLKREEV